MDILDNIVKNNTKLINEKYLIFHVVDKSKNELRRHCYGTLDCCIPTNTRIKETMSLSSTSYELQSNSCEDSK
ncbi:LEF-10 [Choristoneura occidentalis granulovirus]|uniref:LEF-10 n=1 Tax=Choristoneura occidentalis granulovirus TaxID=364745 RepID=Q1A4I4_9BBAC|nr:LEF-10 [Choristoneura fumiferana granulovirus]ABC61246.1 LEF-10 [Choristoneura fumiferana granulovirus]